MKCVEKAYAKVNLTLAVGEKRPDGYHEVVSVMQRVSLHDTLTAERTASGISLTCSAPRRCSSGRQASPAARP